MNIRKTFLKLTERTYPYGFEDTLFCYLPAGVTQDPDGNFYLKIGHSKSIFACHLDTACKKQVEVKHVFDLQWIRTDGKSILGADDKAGMTILLWMIHHNIPGLYYFFIGEEVGCIGSKAASVRKDFFSDYDKIISFDRRGTNSVITHQSSRRTCSDKFATGLAKQLNKRGLSLGPDDTGVYTDSAEFASVIPECTNISVGYQKEHTNQEAQDIVYLESLCHAVLAVDFESLPVDRDPAKYEYKEYKWSGYGYDGYGYDGYGYGKGSSGKYFRDTLGYDDYHDRQDYTKKKRGRGRHPRDCEDSIAYGYHYDQPNYYWKDGKKTFISDNKPSQERKDNYVFLRDMYLNADISKEEMEIIARDFVSNTPEDKDFLKYMMQII